MNEMMNSNAYIQNLLGLNGKSILVTGCASGIGQSFCISLSQAGATNVVGIYNKTEPLNTKHEVEKYGTTFFSKKLDLFDISNIDLEKLFDELTSKIGKIDILINNAGLNIRNMFLEYKQDDWNNVIDLNLKSTFFLSQAFARANIKNNSKCKIINVGSLLSFQGGQRCAAYTASKHGVLGITKLMANELGEYGVNVNCIVPGYIKTKMTIDFIKNTKISQHCLDRIPLKRWGECEDLNGAVLFLASKAADYINGASIVIDGGYINM